MGLFQLILRKIGEAPRKTSLGSLFSRAPSPWPRGSGMEARSSSSSRGGLQASGVKAARALTHPTGQDGGCGDRRERHGRMAAGSGQWGPCSPHPGPRPLALSSNLADSPVFRYVICKNKIVTISLRVKLFTLKSRISSDSKFSLYVMQM